MQINMLDRNWKVLVNISITYTLKALTGYVTKIKSEMHVNQKMLDTDKKFSLKGNSAYNIPVANLAKNSYTTLNVVFMVDRITFYG